MAGPDYVRCAACGDSATSPRAFLLDCCACDKSYHHTCATPPMSEAALLARATATRLKSATGTIHDWRCHNCVARQQLEQLERGRQRLDDVIVISSDEDEPEPEVKEKMPTPTPPPPPPPVWKKSVLDLSPAKKAPPPRPSNLGASSSRVTLDHVDDASSPSTRAVQRAPAANSRVPSVKAGSSRPKPAVQKVPVPPASASPSATSSQTVQAPLSPPPSRTPSQTLPDVDFSKLRKRSRSTSGGHGKERPSKRAKRDGQQEAESSVDRAQHSRAHDDAPREPSPGPRQLSPMAVDDNAAPAAAREPSPAADMFGMPPEMMMFLGDDPDPPPPPASDSEEEEDGHVVKDEPSTQAARAKVQREPTPPAPHANGRDAPPPAHTNGANARAVPAGADVVDLTLDSDDEGPPPSNPPPAPSKAPRLANPTPPASKSAPPPDAPGKKTSSTLPAPPPQAVKVVPAKRQLSPQPANGLVKQTRVDAGKLTARWKDTHHAPNGVRTDAAAPSLGGAAASSSRGAAASTSSGVAASNSSAAAAPSSSVAGPSTSMQPPPAPQPSRPPVLQANRPPASQPYPPPALLAHPPPAPHLHPPPVPQPHPPPSAPHLHPPPAPPRDPRPPPAPPHAYERLVSLPPIAFLHSEHEHSGRSTPASMASASQPTPRTQGSSEQDELNEDEDEEPDEDVAFFRRRSGPFITPKRPMQRKTEIRREEEEREREEEREERGRLQRHIREFQRRRGMDAAKAPEPQHGEWEASAAGGPQHASASTQPAPASTQPASTRPQPASATQPAPESVQPAHADPQRASEIVHGASGRSQPAGEPPQPAFVKPSATSSKSYAISSKLNATSSKSNATSSTPSATSSQPRPSANSSQAHATRWEPDATSSRVPVGPRLHGERRAPALPAPKTPPPMSKAALWGAAATTNNPSPSPQSLSPSKEGMWAAAATSNHAAATASRADVTSNRVAGVANGAAATSNHATATSSHAATSSYSAATSSRAPAAPVPKKPKPVVVVAVSAPPRPAVAAAPAPAPAKDPPPPPPARFTVPRLVGERRLRPPDADPLRKPVNGEPSRKALNGEPTRNQATGEPPRNLANGEPADDEAKAAHELMYARYILNHFDGAPPPPHDERLWRRARRKIASRADALRVVEAWERAQRAGGAEEEEEEQEQEEEEEEDPPRKVPADESVVETSVMEERELPTPRPPARPPISATTSLSTRLSTLDIGSASSSGEVSDAMQVDAVSPVIRVGGVVYTKARQRQTARKTVARRSAASSDAGSSVRAEAEAGPSRLSKASVDVEMAEASSKKSSARATPAATANGQPRSLPMITASTSAPSGSLQLVPLARTASNTSTALAPARPERLDDIIARLTARRVANPPPPVGATPVKGRARARKAALDRRLLDGEVLSDAHADTRRARREVLAAVKESGSRACESFGLVVQRAPKDALDRAR